VLVPGGAGFIGSWTVEALIKARHDVMVYDSFVTGHAEYLGRVLDRVPVLRGVVRQPLALQRAVRRFQPHVIVHLASCVSVPLLLQRALRSHEEAAVAMQTTRRYFQTVSILFSRHAKSLGSRWKVTPPMLGGMGGRSHVCEEGSMP
jgi:UDP-glucose 4-epimerase